jgi:putative ABC transport system permease protein
MQYRVREAATSAQLHSAIQAIAALLPAGSVAGTSTYLDVKKNADLLTAVMVPFLLAFSVFGLIASFLIITNIVSGVVIAGYRDIGIMKSVGFTPGQVVSELLGQILLPAFVGSGIGVVCGTLASHPFLQSTAHALRLPSAFTAEVPVDIAVLSAAVAVAALAGLIPAWRAAHMSAVAAIAAGTSPPVERGARILRLVSHFPLPRPISLGIAEALARPLRSAMTLGAIVIGVATVVFALSLHLSLSQVADHLTRDRYAPIALDVAPPPQGALGNLKGGPPPAPFRPLSASQVETALRNQPDTNRFVGEKEVSVLMPGIAQPVPLYGYQGSSSWLGYALISGRWFARRGEVVAPTRLMREAGLRVGESFTARLGNKLERVKLVGEILDQTGDDVLLRTGWATLQVLSPSSRPDYYEIQVKKGTYLFAYSRDLSQRLAPTGPNPFNIDVRQQNDSSFILLNGTIFGLALILIAVALAGVFNSVVLSTQEKARDVAIFKTVGMAPFQVVAMVVSSAAALGVLAGILGVPLGLELHRQILTLMGQAASGTDIPPAFFDLMSRWVLVLLALSGTLIAALGSWLPAQWAASSGVAEVLSAE